MVLRVLTPKLESAIQGDFASWDIANADVLAVGGTSAQSDVLPAGVYRIIATTDCWVARGDNPTASAADGSIYMPLDVPEYLFLEGDEKLAVIQDSGAGSLSICPATLA